MRRFLPFTSWGLYLAIPLLVFTFLLMVLQMPGWPQTSGLKLNGSGSLSQTWNELYSQGQKIYEKQNDTLTNLNKEISTLKSGYNELTNLSAELSQSNDNLREYNIQILERMQRRDEDLANAYAEIDTLEKYIFKLELKIAKQTTWLFILGGVTALAIVFAVVKIVIAVKTGGAKALVKI